MYKCTRCNSEAIVKSMSIMGIQSNTSVYATIHWVHFSYSYNTLNIISHLQLQYTGYILHKIY